MFKPKRLPSRMRSTSHPKKHQEKTQNSTELGPSTTKKNKLKNMDKQTKHLTEMQTTSSVAPLQPEVIAHMDHIDITPFGVVHVAWATAVGHQHRSTEVLLEVGFGSCGLLVLGSNNLVWSGFFWGRRCAVTPGTAKAGEFYAPWDNKAQMPAVFWVSGKQIQVLQLGFSETYTAVCG